MKQSTTIQLIITTGILLLIGTTYGVNHVPNQTKTISKQTLNIGTNTPIETMDSNLYTSHEAYEALHATMIGLYSHNAKNQVIPAISDNHPQKSHTGLTYVFTLRKFKWSNGDTVRAQDFVYAWRRQVDPKTNSRNASRLDFIKNAAAVRTGSKPVTQLGIKALDSQHLQIKLSAPTPYLTQLLSDATTLPINQRFAEKLGTQYGDSATHVLSDGPYAISGWSGSKDKNWAFIKNNQYRFNDRVKVDRVAFQVIHSAQKTTHLFNTGKLDFAPLTANTIPNYTDTHNIKIQSSVTSAYLFFNTMSGATTDVHLRRALSMAYDKRLLTQSKLKNGAKPLNGLMPQGLTTGPDGMDYRKSTGQLEAYNLTKAAKNWRLAKRDLGVKHLTLNLLIANNSTARITAEFLRGQLEHNLPGLTITISKVSLEHRVQLEAAGKFQLVFSTWTPADDDPYNFLTFYQTGNRQNITGFSSTKIDTLLKQITQNSNNATKRWQLIQKTERYLMQAEVPSSGVFQDGQAYLLNQRVQQFPISASGLINYEYVRLKP
ncbi:putative pheromone binding protein [Secundilactobacillus odoratitofui DSM 19909 = JCM 15043]|uniref:Putative pheromone binding protein n=1 Tax=Secundilactobacillus odoratitofui DSM 19909 = JCM 15043 TaxID=1423776 RepID=A0A0R1LRW1_9LACO|nr:peptide ABC transporter substrate-binding protein [Secundilactobacillus odoratitofui]KRK98523.1 putative pheromone binding protein [Secundilactobacillus odoratitofui DSM 19909 = JCM 15043]